MCVCILSDEGSISSLWEKDASKSVFEAGKKRKFSSKGSHSSKGRTSSGGGSSSEGGGSSAAPRKSSVEDAGADSMLETVSSGPVSDI